MNAGKGKEFIKKIENLIPRGGGDCPELAFQGMYDALSSGFALMQQLKTGTNMTWWQPQLWR